MSRLTIGKNEFKKEPYFSQFFILHPVKFFSSRNSPTTYFSSYCLYKCIWLIIVFEISSFAHSKIAPVGAENTWEKYGTFLNSFHPEVTQLKGELERIKDRIGRHEA